MYIVVGVLHSSEPHDDHCTFDGQSSIDGNGDVKSAGGSVGGEDEPSGVTRSIAGPCRWVPAQLPLSVLASIISVPDDATARVALAVRVAFNGLKRTTDGVDTTAPESCSGGPTSRAHVFVVVSQWWSTHQALAWSRVLGGYESRVSRLRVATLWFSTLGGAYSALGDVK